MGRTKIRVAMCVAASLAAANPADAAEYGLGNYQLGLILPLAGYTPPPGVYFWDTFYHYQGSGPLYQNSRAHTPLRVTYQFAANTAILAWFTDASVLGGELGFASTVAYGSDTTTRALRGNTTAMTVAGYADTDFSAILGWHAGDQHWSMTLTGYAPTGNYDAARIAQTSLNRPSLDIKGAYTFLSPQSGLEASAAMGVMVNGINTATDYQTGAEFHFEWTLAQHLPFGLSAGVGGYFYQQVTADTGAGNTLGSFKGRVAAVGPIVTYTLTEGAQRVDFNARWFHEFGAYNRVSGDTIFATLAFPIASRPAAAMATR